jgi:N-acetyl-beta-hexosaminidase
MDAQKNALHEVTEYFASIYPDIEFGISRNQTELLDYTISNLKLNFSLGFIFICIVVILFLGDVKSPAVIGLSMAVVFPSAKYPKLLRKGTFYTPEQIGEIVDYADERGIVLVPELEGPGHSSVLRQAYPEVFGKPEYRCIDISDDKALEAMKTLTEEVIDAFPASPLFHIGADEADLSGLQSLPHVAAKIKEKGYEDVHDLYLNYLCEMHGFVKSKGRQTCLWEGFDKDGSESVKIPKDVLVFEFETLYQRPDSLAKNGYRMVNTSWEPVYITRDRRWLPKDIFDWNYYTWKHWWEKAPASKAPIVLDEEVRHLVYGAQMCSWDMTEESEYPAVCKRLAAMSEKIWNTGTGDYESFSKRIVNSEPKLRKLLYPFTVTANGLTEPDYEGNDYNRENFFAQQVSLSVKSHLPETVVRYTFDGSFPAATAAVFPESLIIDKSTFIKIGVYDSEGILLSYYPVFYEKK